MVWIFMTVFASVAALVMGGLAVWGDKIGIGADRRGRMKFSAVMLVAWAFIGYGHYLVSG
jgi:hypothetical protein